MTQRIARAVLPVFTYIVVTAPLTGAFASVIEGTAARVTDDATLQHMAKRYADQGWPATVKDGAFTHEYSAPSAGPPPWNLYVLTPATVYGVMSDEPGGAMRWRFDA